MPCAVWMLRLQGLLFASWPLATQSIRSDGFGSEQNSLAVYESAASAAQEKCAEGSLKAFVDPNTTIDGCHRCIEQISGSWIKCKWCPLSQECMAVGLGHGGPCKVRLRSDGEPVSEDMKLTGEEGATHCDDTPSLWMEWMRKTFGEDWEKGYKAHQGFRIRSPAGAAAFQVASVDEAMEKCRKDPECDGFTVEDPGSTTIRITPYSLEASTMTLQMATPREKWVSYLSGKVRHQDAMRCFQWALGWPITQNAGERAAGELSDDDLGSWACTSVLIRYGSSQALGLENGGIVAEMCQVIRIKLGTGVDCQVQMHHATEFAMIMSTTGRLDAASGSISSEMARSISSGPLVSFSPGAGLSGSTFAATWDNQFKIKLGLKESSMSVNEPKILMKMLDGDGEKESLVRHLRNHPHSLLNKYLGLLKVDLGGRKGKHQWGLWMQDASYSIDARATTAKASSPPKCSQGLPCFSRYDLKGESRDQFRKQKPGKMFTLENGDFWEREHGRLALPDEHCLQLRNATLADALFLDSWSLIDYSFFITVMDQPETLGISCEATPGQPLCSETSGMDKLYTVSIIDFLNTYTASKQMESLWYAMRFKGMKFSQYGAKMVSFMQKICRTKEELKKYQPIRDAILQTWGNQGMEVAVQHALDAHKDAGEEITFKGFQAMLEEMGVWGKMRREEWTELFEEADYDGSGKLDINELAYILS